MISLIHLRLNTYFSDTLCYNGRTDFQQCLREGLIIMKYDFTSIIDRRGMDATAIDNIGNDPGHAPDPPDEGFDPIPMWIADMNFATAPSIQDAIIKRVEHPCFGYFPTRDEYYDAIINWHKIRNNVTDMTRECIGYENGVLGGVVSAMNVFCSKGDHVLLHSPTYIGFTSSLRNNGYSIVLSNLKKDENGIYRMDFKDMEEKIRKYKIHAAVICSPHNPCGRVWEQWELEEEMELFKKYNVMVISDEIWSDIITEGYRHIPTQSISEDAKMRTVALYAPSKTFNLAGLIGSYHVIYNPYLRDRIEKESSLCHYNSMNVLSMYALIGAYSPEGMEWVDELREVITGNLNFACSYIHDHFDGVEAACPEGTYMLFLDCTKWCEAHGKTIDELEHEGWRVGVEWQDGRQFHGSCHIRMNLASPLSRIEEAFDRLDKYVFNAEW